LGFSFSHEITIYLPSLQLYIHLYRMYVAKLYAFILPDFITMNHFVIDIDNMRNKKYQTIGTVANSKRQIVQRVKLDIPNSHVHDNSLS
jgi:hypothetical protein